MWFNNVLIYHYELEENTNLTELLGEEALKPCPPHARFIHGWLPSCGDELVHEVAGVQSICMGKEERILPKTVINKILAEKIESIEDSQGRTVKRAEKAQMAEDLEFELLPKAFTIQKQQRAILDSQSQRLYINASSNNQASQLTSFLRKTIPGIKIEPIETRENLAGIFAEWIQNPSSMPANFDLGSDFVLYSRDDEKKRINCKGYDMPAEEILTLLSQGLVASEVSLIWAERIQFTLTQDLVFKRVKSLDYLADEFNEIKDLEEEYQQQDAALALLSGELRTLSNDVLKALESREENFSKTPTMEVELVD